uniref:Glycosyltransferase n=1 Tax=Hordeum vulgare subsp. vulgare TaxID=112509 RepID=A0A8I6YYA8_HORVV
MRGERGVRPRVVKLPVDKEKVPPELPLPGMATPLSPAEFPSFLTDPASSPAYLHLLLKQCEGLEVADHSLINSFDELQPKEAEYLSSRWGAKAVGPSIPSAYPDSRMADDTSYGFHLHTPMAAESKAWLDERPARSVVYVSFGSLATPESAQVAEVAEGLYSGGQPFLWVVRASEAWKLPEGFVDKAKGRGLLVTCSPQLEVLRHALRVELDDRGPQHRRAHGRGAAVVRPANQRQICRGRLARGHAGERGGHQGGAGEVRQGGDGRRQGLHDQGCKLEPQAHKAKKAMSQDGTSDRNIADFLAKLGLST